MSGAVTTHPANTRAPTTGQRGHPVIRSFEPGEEWFYDYRSEEFFEGPALASPESHPLDQPVPGPAGAVPPDWESHLN